MARICLAFLIVLVAAMAQPAAAQTRIVAVVNGAPITNYDVTQRSALLRLTGQKGNLQQMALDELINDGVVAR